MATDSEIRVEWRCGIDAVAPLAAQWDALTLAAPQQLPMLSHSWVEAYAHALLPADAQLLVGLAFADQSLVGVLPLITRRAGMAGRLARSASTPYHEHCAWGDMLVAGHCAEPVRLALLGGMAELPRLREIALRGMVTASPLQPMAPSSPSEMLRVTSHRNRGSYLPIEGDWEKYYARLSKNFRANLRKAGTRMREIDTRSARFECLTGEQALPELLEKFVALEASGWKGRGGSAISDAAAVQAFYQRLVSNLYRRGWLEWHFFMLDEHLVAGQLAVRLNRALILLKIAYDEAHARLSPGALLFEATARRAFAERDTDSIDCLTDMAWHRDWRMPQRDYFDVRLYPRTATAIALGLLPRMLINVAKQAARRTARVEVPASAAPAKQAGQSMELERKK